MGKHETFFKCCFNLGTHLRFLRFAVEKNSNCSCPLTRTCRSTKYAFPKVAKISCKGLCAVFVARLPSDEKGKIESRLFEKHQHDAAYRHRGQILVTLHLSIETVSVTTRRKTKTKRKSVRSVQYVQR